MKAADNSENPLPVLTNSEAGNGPLYPYRRPAIPRGHAAASGQGCGRKSMVFNARLLLLGMGLALCVGCGQKGPLTLPETEQPAGPVRPTGAP
jgi:predicted small lipoprotein YifL